jgi:hypothetical protein
MQSLRLAKGPLDRIRSFLEDRQIRLSFDSQIEESREVETRVPQGSPFSPILFLTYIRDLSNDLQDVYSLFYIDDIGLATSSTSYLLNSEVLQREVAKLVRTGNSKAIQFDLQKIELLHVSKPAEANAASIQLQYLWKMIFYRRKKRSGDLEFGLTIILISRSIFRFDLKRH